MTASPYPFLQIAQNEVAGDEELGTKTKLESKRDGIRWLVKEAREISDATRSKSRRWRDGD